MERCKKGANDGQEYYEVAVNPTDWWTWFKPGYNSDEEWTHVCNSLGLLIGNDLTDDVLCCYHS